MTKIFDIKDKVAVITGGAQSMGLMTAQELIKQGAKVVIGDILDTGAEAVSKLNDQAGEEVAVFQKCDVTNTEQLHALIDFAISHFGQLDILVNNAGVIDRPVQVDHDGKYAQRCISVNFSALVDGTIYAINYWNQDESRQGVVVNLGSYAGYAPAPFIPVYCATKAAVNMFTKTLSTLAPKVRVNAVAPSWVDTKFLDTCYMPRDHLAITLTGVIDPQVVVGQIVRLIQDGSMAGEVIRIENQKEPEVCSLPNATRLMAGIKQKIIASNPPGLEKILASFEEVEK
ncbi:hypothetical protein H4R99_000556 [Coemansia sp. RSA 1722]|nr:hypothetical protein LPJ57_001244 [Coemansia sp. RSA 486]KAJ2238081.1 hypothetical protein IWW45_000421 [Coemansia sp. RSA 485]KAJ2603559.1 hypothetical protein GGF39_000052 [Coemansia sp. RSA 1721]KAJ2606161.1 hypothetical protein H4R99_000556 [Coemansia sp. RSA 1722]KAJ2639716.1 hypothetical protein GGF40_000682 [Coemansia sp. RSA 1286]